jgi:hypothetical protein
MNNNSDENDAINVAASIQELTKQHNAEIASAQLTVNIAEISAAKAVAVAAQVAADAASKAAAKAAEVAEKAVKVAQEVIEKAEHLANANANANAIANANANGNGGYGKQALSQDHDLLQRLDTKVDALKDDIKSLSSGFSEKMNDHENRIRDNEKNITKIVTWGSALTVMIGIGEFLLLHYWK